MVDIPRRKDIISQEQKQKNKLLMQKYNKSGSFPTLLALKSKAKVLGEISGYGMLRNTDWYFMFLDKMIRKY